jgi:hypothetical protein
LPYVEQETTFNNWRVGQNACGNASGTAITPTGTCMSAAVTEIKQFYCPTRRSGWRAGTDDGMGRFGVSAGGTDYGGCAGRVYGWDVGVANYPYVNSANVPTSGQPPYVIPAANSLSGTAASLAAALYGSKTVNNTDSATKEYGIFAKGNESTGFQSIVDGTSNTIMTGELQRITTSSSTNFGPSSGPHLSHDSWAVGGDATLFSTAVIGNGSSTGAASLMNNGDCRSPGSEHSGTVNFGLGDASVRSLSASMDSVIFALLGSMADRTPAGPDSQ